VSNFVLHAATIEFSAPFQTACALHEPKTRSPRGYFGNEE
jgi:hypothetical protein